MLRLEGGRIVEQGPPSSVSFSSEAPAPSDEVAAAPAAEAAAAAEEEEEEKEAAAAAAAEKEAAAEDDDDAVLAEMPRAVRVPSGTTPLVSRPAFRDRRGSLQPPPPLAAPPAPLATPPPPLATPPPSLQPPRPLVTGAPLVARHQAPPSPRRAISRRTAELTERLLAEEGRGEKRTRAQRKVESLTGDEERAVGHVAAHVWRRFGTFVGGCFVSSILLSAVASQLANFGQG